MSACSTRATRTRTHVRTVVLVADQRPRAALLSQRATPHLWAAIEAARGSAAPAPQLGAEAYRACAPSPKVTGQDRFRLHVGAATRPPSPGSTAQGQEDGGGGGDGHQDGHFRQSASARAAPRRRGEECAHGLAALGPLRRGHERPPSGAAPPRCVGERARGWQPARGPPSLRGQLAQTRWLAKKMDHVLNARCAEP